MTDETQKFIYLVDELDVAMELLKAGLRSLQAIDGANDFYHLPLLTLASGLERFTKVIICFHVHEVEGSFPSKLPWEVRRGAGHDRDRSEAGPGHRGE